MTVRRKERSGELRWIIEIPYHDKKLPARAPPEERKLAPERDAAPLPHERGGEAEDDRKREPGALTRMGNRWAAAHRAVLTTLEGEGTKANCFRYLEEWPSGRRQRF